jgi:V8-like Glu-specific endopeptidase
MQFQQDVAGLASASVPVAIEPDKYFATSLEDDLSVVRLADGAAATWGALDITPRDVAMDDRVNIVQHPGGGYKQLSFFANVVVFVGGGRVQYLTDTLPGSSGAPVFDRQWNLVAVHHSGGWLTEPGSTDPKRVFYRNEGILLDRLPPLLPK